MAKTFEEMWNTFYNNKEEAKLDWQAYEAAQQQKSAAMVAAALREAAGNCHINAVDCQDSGDELIWQSSGDIILNLITPSQQTALERHDAELREKVLEEAIAALPGDAAHAVPILRALKESRT